MTDLPSYVSFIGLYHGSHQIASVVSYACFVWLASHPLVTIPLHLLSPTQLMPQLMMRLV